MSLKLNVTIDSWKDNMQFSIMFAITLIIWKLDMRLFISKQYFGAHLRKICFADKLRQRYE